MNKNILNNYVAVLQRPLNAIQMKYKIALTMHFLKLIGPILIFVFSSNLLAQTPHTSVLVKYYDQSESPRIIANRLSTTAVRSASTHKLFVAWKALYDGLFDQEQIGEMLKMSNNQMAQEIYTKFGGAVSLRKFLTTTIGLPVTRTNFNVVDGSGLSHSNKSTCDLQIKLLENIYESALYDTYKNLLAQPAQRGTLESRLTEYDGSLFAKTGTLAKTSALTGFVEMPKGTVMFCIISENFNRTWPQERARIDALLRSYLKEIEAL